MAQIPMIKCTTHLWDGEYNTITALAPFENCELPPEINMKKQLVLSMEDFGEHTLSIGDYILKMESGEIFPIYVEKGDMYITTQDNSNGVYFNLKTGEHFPVKEKSFIRSKLLDPLCYQLSIPEYSKIRINNDNYLTL
jgi:hypothetical protein